MVDASKLLNNLYLARLKFLSLLREFWKVSFVKKYAIILVALNFLNWAIVYKIYSVLKAEDLVILHYNIDFGVNLIGSPKQIFIIPFLGLTLIFINLVLSSFFLKQNNFLAHMILGGSVAVNIFLLIDIASVYLINFY